MAIDTTNKKLAVMEMEEYWEPGLPLLPGVFDQGELQQLLWGYPGITWDPASPLPYIQDLNTRLFCYLKHHYTEGDGADLTTMAMRYLNGLSGDYNNRMARLIEDATA